MAVTTGQPFWRFRASLLFGVMTLGACYTPPPLDSGAALRAHRKGLLRSSSTNSEGAPQVGTGLTEEGAVKMAMDSSPSIQTARAGVEEAKGNAVRTRSFDNPELRVDNSFLQHGNNSEDRDVYKFGLGLRLPIPSLAERPARIDAADAAVVAAATGQQLEETQVRREVRLAYARAAAAQARVMLFTRLTETRMEREKNLATAVEGGHGVAIDLAQIRVAIGDAMDRRSMAEEDLADAQATLARALGGASPSPDALRIGSMPECHAPPPEELSAIEERAVEQSPTLEHLRATHRQAEEEARAEHLARVPRLKYLELGYTHNSLMGNAPTNGIQEYEPRYYSWSVHASVGLDIPVWNMNGGKIQTAEAKLSAQTARFRETLSATVSGLRRTLVRWQKAHDRAERATTVTIPAAEEALKLTRQAVEGMRLPATASLQAEEKLILSRIQLIDDLYQCRWSEAEVEAALGLRRP